MVDGYVAGFQGVSLRGDAERHEDGLEGNGLWCEKMQKETKTRSIRLEEC